MDAKGELMITIMSSLAQEESRSISENTTWGKRKQFADGKGSVAYSWFLGYDKDFKINEEQAATVRLIYRLFPQYYVEEHHEAIIPPAQFDFVQAELTRREQNGRYSGVSIFSNKIKCGCCGGWYGSKVWHSTDKYRKVIYLSLIHI